MLNVTDQYCISPATSKGGFSCHPGEASFLALQDVQSKISHNGFVIILCPSKQSSSKARLHQHQ